jgi:hypothetical protein
MSSTYALVIVQWQFIDSLTSSNVRYLISYSVTCDVMLDEMPESMSLLSGTIKSYLKYWTINDVRNDRKREEI